MIRIVLTLSWNIQLQRGTRSIDSLSLGNITEGDGDLSKSQATQKAILLETDHAHYRIRKQEAVQMHLGRFPSQSKELCGSLSELYYRFFFFFYYFTLG